MRDFQDVIKSNERTLEAKRNNLKEIDKQLNQARNIHVQCSMALHEYEREIITAPTDDKYKLSLMYRHMLSLQNDAAAQADEVHELGKAFLSMTIRILELEHENEKIKEMLHLN